MKRGSSGRNLAILIGVVLGVSLWGWVFPAIQRWRETRLTPQNAISREQICRIGEAVAKFVKAKGERPERLEQLVQEGKLEPAALFDERRDEVPKIDEKTGRFVRNPDVLYFPAVRKDDPGELVLLCTLLLRKEGEMFHVIRNDGTYAGLSARELVIALNRTYRYLGREIAERSKGEPTHAAVHR